MERLPVRYAAIVCVVVGAMFIGGAGAVAFATPGTDDGDGSNSSGGTQNTGPRFGGWHLPSLSGSPGFGDSSFSPYTVGPIAPPAMNLPQLLGPGSSSTNVANLMLPGPGTPSLSMLPLVPLTVPAPDPAGQPVPDPAALRTPALQRSYDTRVLDSPQSDGPTKQSPTSSLLPLVPPWVPTGQPVTINNPLPAKLPLDLHQPIVPQLLPPPLVVILMAAAQRFPLAGLVITPVLTAKVPPFIADLVIPALLSDIVLPTLPLGAVLPAGTIPDAASLAAPAAFAESAGGSLPAELGVMGMDVPQAPDLTPRHRSLNRRIGRAR